ncbi:MAG: methylated-DNA--[protein]-cysteine S-methyltransferase [Puniceicoccaceae bacterium]
MEVAWSPATGVLAGVRFADEPAVPPGNPSGSLAGFLSGLRPFRLAGGAGTPFFREIWLHAAAVPPGTTTTYGDLARRCGCPGAARAVGRAMAANPFALVVPCHRVVPAAGGPGAYRWGPERKLRLLARESGGRSAWESLSPNL